MLGDISGAANIYIITGYTDMRKSIDVLCAIITSHLQQEPCRQKGLCDIFPCDRL
ncbi:MAG: transposase [Lachnospiraceae bacterium]|nr:transposase [Lachnospiraceae bacterium]